MKRSKLRKTDGLDESAVERYAALARYGFKEADALQYMTQGNPRSPLLQVQETFGTPARAESPVTKRRLAQALELKAAALRIVESEGARVKISGIDILHAQHAGLNVWINVE